MAVNIVTTPNLGSEFDLGVVEANKITLKLGNALVKDAGTGAIGVDPSALAITNVLSAAAPNLTSTVNGVASTVDLTALVQAVETLTSLAAGATAAAALSYTDEDGVASVINLTNAIKDGETTTVLGYNPATTILTYTDEDGGVTTIDLSALTTDIYVDGATFNPTTLALTLTDNDGGTPDVVVDLSQLRVTVTNNGDGTYTIAQAGNSSIIDTREGVSADAGNLLSVGADLKPFMDAGDVRSLLDVAVTDAFGTIIFYAASTNS